MQLHCFPFHFICIFGVLLLNIVICIGQIGFPFETASLQKYSEDSKSQKFLPFLPVYVTIVNSPCVPKLSGASGICYTKKQCRNINGIEDGSCASGFGVCCIALVTCGADITQNNTYFRSRGYPDTLSTLSRECSIKIKKSNNNVCQVRLDFVDFQIGNPNNDGRCTNDYLQTNSLDTENSAPDLCGNLSGQHVYLNYGKQKDITLRIGRNAKEKETKTKARDSKKKWNIKITFVECTSVSRAPAGCLQYHLGAVGSVMSLGYPNIPHLANLDYTVCVRPEDGSHSIVWQTCKNEDGPTLASFLLTGNAEIENDNQPMETDGTLCRTDCVLLMTDEENVVTETGESAGYDRYCGNSFAATIGNQVISKAKPYIMQVKTDSDEPAEDVMNGGFCLEFTQNVNG